MSTATKEKVVHVWGIAAGTGSTKGAARGAFTWRDYPTLAEFREAENKDWLRILQFGTVKE